MYFSHFSNLDRQRGWWEKKKNRKQTFHLFICQIFVYQFAPAWVRPFYASANLLSFCFPCLELPCLGSRAPDSMHYISIKIQFVTLFCRPLKRSWKKWQPKMSSASQPHWTSTREKWELSLIEKVCRIFLAFSLLFAICGPFLSGFLVFKFFSSFFFCYDLRMTSSSF